MRLGEKKQQALYDAIHEPIMQLRIEIALREKGTQQTPARLDSKLFNMVTEIWHKQAKILKIEP